MTRPPSAGRPSSVRPEAYGDDGPSWVVARAEAELVERYGWLDESESGLTGAMFEPPAGVFLVARAADGPRPVGGVGVRSVGTVGTGEVKRLWVDPTWRGRGLGRRLMGELEDAARSKPITSPRRCRPGASGIRKRGSARRSGCPSQLFGQN